MTSVKIYDYTHKMKGHYFIRSSGKIVLIDLEYSSIKVSSFWLKLFFRFTTSNEIKQDSPLYQHVLEKYDRMLGELVVLRITNSKK